VRRAQDTASGGDGGCPRGRGSSCAPIYNNIYFIYTLCYIYVYPLLLSSYRPSSSGRDKRLGGDRRGGGGGFLISKQ
jgi:hypothetical protein